MSPRHIPFRVAVFAALAVFLGAAADAPGQDAAKEGKKDGGKVRVLDSFETLWPWSNEAADDHATLNVVKDKVTAGKRALRVDFEAFGREKFQVRRDGRIDLSGGGKILVDIYNGARRMRVGLGLETGRPARYFESAAVTLEPGWNRNLSFSLTEPNFSHGDGAHRFKPDNLRDTLKLSLIFFEDGNPRGAVYIDNLRLAKPGAVVGEALAPKLKAVKILKRKVSVYGRLEIEVDVEGTFKNYFDKNDIDVWASFYSPAGRKYVIPGFFDGFRADRSPALPVWRIRFAPNRPGRWICEVAAKNRHGRAVSSLKHFQARADPKRKGFIRVSSKDPRYFEYDNGDFFYVIGQNVAWASNIGRYFEAMSAYGGKVARIWLCPWHLSLERKREPGRFNLNVAQQIDAILDLAEAWDIHIIFVLYYHGSLREGWTVSPYNAANGGPCSKPREFFTNPQAIQLTRRYFRYVAARYGFSTRVFAWEIFNEANYTAYGRFSDVVNWHSEVAGYLRSADPFHHLITTSAGDMFWRAQLLELREIDFLSPHLYTTDLGVGVDRIAELARPIRKPIFLGEFAGFPNAADERADRKGVYLHAGLWYTFMTPWAGSGLPWWWDTHIEADNLYHHLRALAEFAKGEDRRGHPFRLVETKIPTGGLRQADVRGILAPTLAYVWVFDAEQMRNCNATPRPVVEREATLKLVGMAKGWFQAEIWDTWAGKRLSTSRVESRGGRLSIRIARTVRDIAVKVKRIPKRPAEPAGRKPRSRAGTQ